MPVILLSSGVFPIQLHDLTGCPPYSTFIISAIVAFLRDTPDVETLWVMLLSLVPVEVLERIKVQAKVWFLLTRPAEAADALLCPQGNSDPARLQFKARAAGGCGLTEAVVAVCR